MPACGVVQCASFAAIATYAFANRELVHFGAPGDDTCGSKECEDAQHPKSSLKPTSLHTAGLHIQVPEESHHSKFQQAEEIPASLTAVKNRGGNRQLNKKAHQLRVGLDGPEASKESGNRPGKAEASEKPPVVKEKLPLPESDSSQRSEEYHPSEGHDDGHDYGEPFMAALLKTMWPGDVARRQSGDGDPTTLDRKTFIRLWKDDSVGGESIFQTKVCQQTEESRCMDSIGLGDQDGDNGINKLFDIVDIDDNDKIHRDDTISILRALAMLAKVNKMSETPELANYTVSKGSKVDRNQVNARLTKVFDKTAHEDMARRAKLKENMKKGGKEELARAVERAFAQQMQADDVPQLSLTGMEAFLGSEDLNQVLKDIGIGLDPAFRTSHFALAIFLLDVDEDGSIHADDFIPILRALCRLKYEKKSAAPRAQLHYAIASGILGAVLAMLPGSA